MYMRLTYFAIIFLVFTNNVDESDDYSFLETEVR